MNAIPSEFAAFVRETGIRAFDRVAGKARTLDKSLQSVLKSWSKLSDEKKDELFDRLIAAVRNEDEPVVEPVVRRRSVKRYDPDEVKKTLPKKKVVKKKAAKPKK
jgi:hypothetical protein